MGVVTEQPFPTYPHGFPFEVLDPFMHRTGRGVLGNKAASGTEIIEELGEEHQRTGKWIAYTSADSVFQIAAHVDTIPLDELYRGCEIAREILTGKHAVGRVIARPFEGEPGNYARTPDRHDWSLKPRQPNYLTLVREAGRQVHAVGKIRDIFAGVDIDESNPTRSNVEGITQTERLLKELDDGLIFVNLVETDMLWGRRRDGERLARREGSEARASGPADRRALIRPADLIQRKRDGGELSDDELTELILGFTRGEVPDYQLAAFCMAVYFRGLSPRETHALTDAMVRSGETIDLQAELGRPVADKHSTGGVGDKASLVVGPLVAACGVPFGKMSGRGLGHTGGTLDKLESIPGFRIELSRDEFVDQVRNVGLAIIGQTAELVPADRKLYGLRDVTATVENVSLIAASIMSKKIAAGANAIVLDVKVGDGAFMKSLEDARNLAEAMLELGRRADRRVVCELTDMDQPLGRAVGNALEIREAIATLRGEGPADLTELSVASAAHLVTLCDGADLSDARARVAAALDDGSALDAFDRWVRAQGGNPEEDALPRAPVVHEVRSSRDGMVARLGALAVGMASVHLGAGRAVKDAPIDHAVGIICRAKRGNRVAQGDVLAEIHARDDASADAAVVEVDAAYELADEAPPPGGVVLETLS